MSTQFPTKQADPATREKLYRDFDTARDELLSRKVPGLSRKVETERADCGARGQTMKVFVLVSVGGALTIVRGVFATLADAQAAAAPGLRWSLDLDLERWDAPEGPVSWSIQTATVPGAEGYQP